MNKKLIFFAPLFVLLGVCVLLIAGLNQDPKKIASALIDKPVPEFYQATLHEPSQIVSPKDFPKQPFLLNFYSRFYSGSKNSLFCDRTFIRIFLIRPSGNGGYLSIPKSR